MLSKKLCMKYFVAEKLHCRVQAGIFKGTLPDLRQFLATESPLKMMKNAFYFTSKAIFALKMFKVLS